MKKIIKFSVAALLLVALASCTTFKLSGAQMTLDTPSFTPVGELDITIRIDEFLGGSGGANLGNITSDVMDDKIYDAIQREIRRAAGDGAVNITIEYKATFVDILLNALTQNIYAPAHAHVTGTIVKFN